MGMYRLARRSVKQVGCSDLPNHISKYVVIGQLSSNRQGSNYDYRLSNDEPQSAPNGWYSVQRDDCPCGNHRKEHQTQKCEGIVRDVGPSPRSDICESSKACWANSGAGA